MIISRVEIQIQSSFQLIPKCPQTNKRKERNEIDHLWNTLIVNIKVIPHDQNNGFIETFSKAKRFGFPTYIWYM